MKIKLSWYQKLVNSLLFGKFNRDFVESLRILKGLIEINLEICNPN